MAAWVGYNDDMADEFRPMFGPLEELKKRLAAELHIQDNREPVREILARIEAHLIAQLNDVRAMRERRNHS